MKISSCEGKCLRSVTAKPTWWWFCVGNAFSFEWKTVYQGLRCCVSWSHLYPLKWACGNEESSAGSSLLWAQTPYLTIAGAKRAAFRPLWAVVLKIEICPTLWVKEIISEWLVPAAIETFVYLGQMTLCVKSHYSVFKYTVSGIWMLLVPNLINPFSYCSNDCVKGFQIVHKNSILLQQKIRAQILKVLLFQKKSILILFFHDLFEVTNLQHMTF